MGWYDIGGIGQKSGKCHEGPTRGQASVELADEGGSSLRCFKTHQRTKLRVIAGYSTTGFNPGHLVSRETADMSEYVH